MADCAHSIPTSAVHPFASSSASGNVTFDFTSVTEVPILPASPRIAAAHPDAAVIDLAERVKALAIRDHRVWDRLATAEDAIDEGMPPRPECRRLDPPIVNENWRSDGSRGPLFDPPDFVQRVRDAEAEHRAAVVAHERTWNETAASRGLPRLERLATRLSRRLRRWAVRLTPLAPQTQAGLAAKAAAALAVSAGGFSADWTDALMAAVGRDALRIATGLADGDPIITMHRRAEDLFALADLDTTSNDELERALVEPNALVLKAAEHPPTTTAGATAALALGIAEARRMQEQRDDATPYDRACIALLQGALDVFRRLPDGVLPVVPAPDADDAPLTVAGIAAMEFRPWPDAQPPAHLRTSIGPHITTVELGWGICSKTKAELATAIGRAIDEGSGDIFGRLKRDLDSTHKLLQELSDVVSTASLRLVVGGSVIACDPRYAALGDNPCGFAVGEDAEGTVALASEAA